MSVCNRPDAEVHLSVTPFEAPEAATLHAWPVAAAPGVIAGSPASRSNGLTRPAQYSPETPHRAAWRGLRHGAVINRRRHPARRRCVPHREATRKQRRQTRVGEPRSARPHPQRGTSALTNVPRMLLLTSPTVLIGATVIGRGATAKMTLSTAGGPPGCSYRGGCSDPAWLVLATAAGAQRARVRPWAPRFRGARSPSELPCDDRRRSLQ